MVKPRSSNPDLVNQTLIKLHWVKLVHNSFKSGSYYVLGDTTWTTTNLTWALEPGIRSDAIKPIKCAFQSWENATKFKFEKIDNYTKANVKISFTPIDQLREFLEYPKSVALSSYPPDGLLHFRADVPWVNGAQRGKMDIETVAVHELGHILGLEHSDVPSAVMYPTTKWGVIKRNLHEDDIAGIKEMYNFP
ncbi:metalloendoproteinase 1-like [Impatiens glandulifera]|uniref:metalloendoproteinase 1-like n=1 Tax=Impatiens glandulifera TaxID=253017 RepID=UPI001FB0C072|nr:metalloendoproteinase 1-like [Impatiens glandulifera]